jgi:thymidylate kinase
MSVFTVALIGPDGSGKTTIAQRVAESLPMRAKYLYMGVNWEASNYLLPTTRAIERAKDALRRRSRPAPSATPAPQPSNGRTPTPPPWRRALRATADIVYLTSLLTEEWYRQLVAWRHLRGGGVVIFDRHFFFDFYMGDVASDRTRRLDRRLHGFFLTHVYPKPDLTIYLDAPAELLLERKGEGTLEWLEQRKREYLDLSRTVDNFLVVNAGRPVHEVVDDVADAIIAFTPTSR